ncbi:MAG: DNA gyrase inhibitor YacG [Nitrospinaceae bacterium]
MFPASTNSRRCPTCKKPVKEQGTPFFPFCCERCKLIDLGAWLDGKFIIEGDRISPDAGHPPEEE